MVNKSADLTAERIESLKAGVLAALSFTLASSIATVGNSLILSEQFEVLAALQATTPGNLLLRVAIAFLSGFLFGVTYRYIIRDDDNPQLKAGAVFAFGLVRGLATVEVRENFIDAFGLLGVLSIESILCFLVARLAIDWAIQRQWVKPFKSS